MPQPGHTTHKLAAAIGVSAALWLSACGGSSKPSTESASARARATTSQQQSSATTQTSSSTTPAAKSSTTTQTSTRTTVTESASLPPAEQARHDRAARKAIMLLSSCLRSHGVRVPPQRLAGVNPTFNSKGLHAPPKVFQACVKKAVTAFHAAGG